MDLAPAAPTQPPPRHIPVVTLDIAIDDVNAKRAGHAPGESSPHKEPTELRRTIARNLRLARVAAGLSQHGLAVAASSDAGVVADIEANAANMTLDTLTRLTHALGLTEIDLLLPNLERLERLKHVVRTKVSPRPRGPRSKPEPTELQRRLACNLRAKRLEAKLLQKDLATSAGIARTLVRDIERHCQNVTLDTVTRLAIPLGCTEIDLLGPVPAVAEAARSQT